MLEVDALDVFHGDAQALDQVSLAVPDGAIVAIVGSYGVMGVSVGDSEAWVVGPRGDCLTERQDRARVGSRRCRPTTFHRSRLEGVLVVGTDGLYKHARGETIVTSCAGEDMATIADRLVELPRLPSRAYPDDVAVVVVSPASAR